jgi:hypothetical protein
MIRSAKIAIESAIGVLRSRSKLVSNLVESIGKSVKRV